MSEKLIPAGYLNAARLEAFAQASGDQNPIHLSEEVAKRSGLPGVIVHGMLTASLMSSFACEWLEQQSPGTVLRGMQIRFRAMVQRDESLVLRIAPKGQSSIEVTAKNARAELVASLVASYGEGFA